jgi:hypothetical protein
MWIADAASRRRKAFHYARRRKLTAFLNLNRRLAANSAALRRKRLKATIPAKGNASHKVEKALLCEDFHENSAWQFPENDNEKQRGLIFYT